MRLNRVAARYHKVPWNPKSHAGIALDNLVRGRARRVGEDHHRLAGGMEGACRVGYARHQHLADLDDAVAIENERIVPVDERGEIVGWYAEALAKRRREMRGASEATMHGVRVEVLGFGNVCRAHGPVVPGLAVIMPAMAA